MKRKYYNLNQRIKAREVRVIDSSGKQAGILPIDKALKLAKDKELDLVEIAPTANPPVAKIVDFKRFLYEQELKEKKAAKKVKQIETKEIRVRPFISDHDLGVRLKHAKKFLSQGDNVKLVIQFRPREMRHPEFGENVIEKFKEQLGDFVQVGREAKWEGRRLTVIFSKGSHAKGQN